MLSYPPVHFPSDNQAAAREEAKKMRAFFDRGNAYTLRKLKEYVEKKPTN